MGSSALGESLIPQKHLRNYISKFPLLEGLSAHVLFSTQSEERPCANLTPGLLPLLSLEMCVLLLHASERKRGDGGLMGAEPM